MFGAKAYRRSAATALLGIAAITAPLRSSAAPSAWLTGSALDEQLRSISSVSWTNTPLSRALASLRSAQHIAIILDRRVDPEREIRLDLPREPLANILRKIAQQSQLGYCQLGEISYFGPLATARQLRTVAALRTEEAQSLAAPRSRKLLARAGSHWGDLAEPRAILTAWADEAGVKLVGLEKIPHDLWPAATLPAMSWTDRFTLVAAQFDLTFRIDRDGRQIELVPMPAKAALVRNYRVTGPPAAAAERWVAELPQAVISASGGQVRVEGLLEDHEFIARRLRGTPPRRATTATGKEVYQVSIENAPLEQVTVQLGQRLGLEFKWDRAAIDKAGIAIDQLISIRVENADVDDLLRSVFQGTGLTFERKDRNVHVRPSANPN
jgi:hypothetical protein